MTLNLALSAEERPSLSLAAFIERVFTEEELFTIEELADRFATNEVYVREMLMRFKRDNPLGKNLQFFQRSDGVRIFYLMEENPEEAYLLKKKDKFLKFGIVCPSPSRVRDRVSLMTQLGVVDEESIVGRILVALCTPPLKSPKDLAILFGLADERINMANILRRVVDKLPLFGLTLHSTLAGNGTREKVYQLLAPQLVFEKDPVEDWIKKHRGLLFSVAQRILADQAAAEDAVADAMVRVNEKMRVRSNTHFSLSYATRAVRNQALNTKRTNRSRAQILAEESKKDSPLHYQAHKAQDTALEMKEASLELRRLIQRLSNEHREVLSLFYFEDLSAEEIANVLKIPLGTVQSRTSRAKEALKDIMDEEGLDLSDFV